MLYQTDICLAPFDSTGLYSDVSVKIHGAVMGLIPPETAQAMHTQKYHPLSVFAVSTPGGYIIRVSALNDEARCIPEVLSECGSICIRGCNGNRPVPVSGCESAPAVTAEMLAGLISPRGCRLELVTPAAVKTGGTFSAKPELCAYLYSVMLKYNEFEHGALEFDAVQEAFRAVRFGEYRLGSTQYRISGRTFPGMTGFCELFFPDDPAQNSLLRLLLAYASYCGIGAKTAQGMGGIILQRLH